MSAPPATALSSDEFARCLDRLGPLEPGPAVAVAVSGGADSLALTHLVQDTIGARGGNVAAVTIDHGLRDGSADEASRVSEWLRDARIDHTILRWSGHRPAGNLQAQARQARYALLDQFCRDRGILHLLTAHHTGDQLETRVLRLSRKAGPWGLAGMSAVEPLEHCEIMRPLLSVSPDRLTATLRTRNLPWIDDPSNADRRFDRVRVRDGLRNFPETDADMSAMAETRARDERAVAQLLARAVTLNRFGAAHIARQPFIDAEANIAAHALGAVLTTVGGAEFPPRRDKIVDILEEWRTALPLQSRTLGGCLLMSDLNLTMGVTREAGRITHRLPLEGQDTFLWDGRFRLRVLPAASGLSVSRLTEAGWRACRAAMPWVSGFGLPAPVRAAIPAVFRGHELMGIPGVDAWFDHPDGPKQMHVSAAFSPRRALSRADYVAPTNLV